jgi:hypothetical protein
MALAQQKGGVQGLHGGKRGVTGGAASRAVGRRRSHRQGVPGGRHAGRAPIAANLQDGRVLVAGGYDLDAAELWSNGAGSLRSPAGVALAEYRPARREGSGSLRAPLGNTVPAGVVPVLATAELYDPATNKWSATGPLRVARFGDAAVTLADGRVLVVPDAFPPFDGWSRVWDWLGVKEHERA